MTNLIIIGAGGFGLEVAAYAEDLTRSGKTPFNLLGFLDDIKPANSRHVGIPVLGDTDQAVDPHAEYIIAVGSCEGRKILADKFSSRGARFITLIHPLSYIAPYATIGAGTIIAPFAFVGAAGHIAEHCVLNAHSSMGHESRSGDCSILAPFATLHGKARLGKGVFVGSHAVVTAGKSIDDGAKIAAGAVVYNSVPAYSLAMGNPAAFRKSD